MLCSLKRMNRRWTSFKLSNLTQGIVSSRLQGTSLQSASSCQARAVSIPGPFVSITTKSWTLFKTNWQVSVLVNTELFIWNIHRRTAKFVLPRKPFLSQRWVPYNFFFCYHVTILQVILVFVLHLCLMISGNARGHLHTLKI